MYLCVLRKLKNQSELNMSLVIWSAIPCYVEAMLLRGALVLEFHVCSENKNLSYYNSWIRDSQIW